MLLLKLHTTRLKMIPSKGRYLKYARSKFMVVKLVNTVMTAFPVKDVKHVTLKAENVYATAHITARHALKNAVINVH